MSVGLATVGSERRAALVWASAGATGAAGQALIPLLTSHGHSVTGTSPGRFLTAISTFPKPAIAAVTGGSGTQAPG